MLVYTIIQIVWYTISQALLEMLVSAHSQKPNEKFKEKDIENAKIGFGCLSIITLCPFLLSHFIYLLYFLNIGTLKWITFGMIGLLILTVLRSIVLSAYRKITKKKAVVKRTVWGYVNIFFTVAFYAYALYILIVNN